MTYLVFLQSDCDDESIGEDLRNGDEMSLGILGENDCSASPAHIGTDQFCWKYCPLLAGSGQLRGMGLGRFIGNRQRSCRQKADLHGETVGRYARSPYLGEAEVIG